ncbi:MAG: modification methylase MjaII [Candidatus Micrarchaeota archaeon]|nr:MAG: modification methylase MjaII [Candidatus Micrarchaeota archaeon]
MNEATNENKEYDRKLILLENDSEPSIHKLKTILQSPLGLAQEIAIKCFQTEDNKGLLSYKDDLDILKRLGAGLESAMNKSEYPIANYSSYIFAFQQFIHSSYRARQGNFAESVIRAILTEAKNVKVYTKKEHSTISEIALGQKLDNKHDLDVIASRQDEYLFVQIRSRDDTGGTTAKGSLAEFLRDVIRAQIIPKHSIRYVIFIWVELQAAQKVSLIKRISNQLSGFSSISSDEIEKKLLMQKKVELLKNLTLEVCYGFKAFSDILGEFSGSDSIVEISNRVFATLQDWDDLWLTYALSTIELQNLIIKKINNFKILEEKLHQHNIVLNESDLSNYKKRSIEIAHLLLEDWKEDTLPVRSPRDQLWYIRDLILVKMLSYHNYKNNKNEKIKPDNSIGKEGQNLDLRNNKDYPNQFKVSFRNLFKSSIHSTTYASHGMYYYPAKFIPQVVRWAIERYTKEGDNILDPFAGSGTVGVEALITNRNATCIDLSPMLKYLLEGKTYRNASLEDLLNKARKIIENTNIEYLPKWSKIEYWYPNEIYSVLLKMWSGYQNYKNPLILLALLKTSKKFSYADNEVPKLFRSKKKIEEISKLLKTDFVRTIHNYFLKTVEDMYNYSNEFNKLYKGGKLNILDSTDMLNYNLQEKYDLLITSPPYGQAHEYIRSIKLELGWLGYSDEEIRELSKHEIPYNNAVPDITIKSETYNQYIKKIDGKTKNYAITYFKSILYILDKCMNALKPSGVAAIFVGNATFSGIEFPFYQIFREHFESNGFQFELLLEDRIVGRRLFKGRKNLSPAGIKSEYMLVMRKTLFKQEIQNLTLYGTKKLF